MGTWTAIVYLLIVFPISDDVFRINSSTLSFAGGSCSMQTYTGVCIPLCWHHHPQLSDNRGAFTS